MYKNQSNLHEIKQKKRYFKIVNTEQARYFFKQGAELVDFGIDKGFVYHLFVRDDISEDIFTRWCNNKHDDNRNDSNIANNK